MREFVANFQQKYGQQVPMSKIYGDEDSSDSEGLELADGTKVGKKTTGGAGGSGRGKPRKKPTASGGTSTGGSDGASTSGGGGVGGSGGDDPGRGRKQSRGDEGDGGDDPNKCRKTGGEGGPLRLTVARKEPRKVGTAYPPVNRKLPVLYISHKKERTMLGHRVLDWTPAQLRMIHEARMQERLVKPHRYRAGTAALKDILTSKKPQYYSSGGCLSRGW